MVHGVMILCFDARILGFARVNPRFSLLAETFDHMIPRLVNFALVLMMLLVMFSIEAMVMFGDKIPGFSTFGISLIECILMAFGSSAGKGKRRKGGGSGAILAVDFFVLSEAAPEVAWLFYYPFVFVIAFVVLNITVAIIGDSYSTIKKRQDPEDKDFFDGAPSERRAGKVTSLWHQLTAGFWRRVASLRGTQDSMSKESILAFCKSMKRDDTVDYHCSTIPEASNSLSRHCSDADSVACDLEDENEKAECAARNEMASDQKTRWIAERYAVAINNEDDLTILLNERLPPPPTPVQLMSQFEVAVENIVSNQSKIHARVDYVISLLIT
mmetsp:Transcript_51977/g.76084  ORF Transcript_51977/g.76084 Transcript_51977/m.76084 type:complete len:328 (-) Transcript_51977:1240-2223(-)